MRRPGRWGWIGARRERSGEGLERSQFTFYVSFYKAAGLLRKKTERCQLYDTICAFALDGEEPPVERLAPAVALAWELIRPNLEVGRRKAVGGKKSPLASGGEKEGRCREDKGKMQTSCGEDSRNKKEGEKEKEDKCPTHGEGEGEDEVVNYLIHRVELCPSPRCREELREFESVLGREVCLRAMDEAADAGKRSWAYIRGILRAKQEQGVRSLADWDRLEQARREGKAGGGRPVPSNRIGTVPGVVDRSPDRKALEEMERMRRYMERMKQEG